MGYNEVTMARPGILNAVRSGGSFQVDQNALGNDFKVLSEVRKGFEEFMKVNFEETGFLSQAEYDSQKRYIESIAHDSEQLSIAHEEYAGSLARKTMETNTKVYYEEFLTPLSDALKGDRSTDGRPMISQSSYDEWIKWIHDHSRDAGEKKKSIQSTLPMYLSERRELAKDRSNLLKMISQINDVSDPTLKKSIEDVRDDNAYFSKYSFTERKNLIDGIRASLSVMEGGDKYKKLYEAAKAKLEKATEKPHPALHKDKVGVWLKRIFEDGRKKGASIEEMTEFIKKSGAGTLDDLINVWRSVAMQFWTIRRDPAFQGIKPTFIDTKAFLWMHYDARVEYVQSMRREAELASDLRSEAAARIRGSAFALDAGGPERYLKKYFFNGKFTLKELESIIRSNMTQWLDEKVKIFGRFEKATAKAKKYSGIRGMNLPEKSGFLRLYYKNQLSKVKEMEMRLLELEKNRPNFLLVRHHMDRRDWDAALEILGRTSKKDSITLEDERQIMSMKEYIENQRKDSQKEEEEIGESFSEARQIDDIIKSLPIELQGMAVNLASLGADAIAMFGWGMYNREWCNRNGYLNVDREQAAIRKGKVQAKRKDRRSQRRGVVNETIQGDTGEQEFIELSRTSATNVCLDINDSGAKNALAQVVQRTKNDHRAWYWTNIIFHRGGGLMNLAEQKLETKKFYRIGKLLRSLGGKGKQYTYGGTSVTLAAKTAQVYSKKGASHEMSLAA